MNHLVFIKRQLYILKRQYGNPVDIYDSSESIDLTTGIKTIVKNKIHVKRAIILPMSLVSESTFNQAYMKNIGREYAYGNILMLETKTVIIDQKDLPKAFNLTPDNYLIIDNSRFEVMKVEKLEKNLGYSLILKRSTGVQTGSIYTEVINQSMSIFQRCINAS